MVSFMLPVLYHYTYQYSIYLIYVLTRDVIRACVRVRSPCRHAQDV